MQHFGVPWKFSLQLMANGLVAFVNLSQSLAHALASKPLDTECSLKIVFFLKMLLIFWTLLSDLRVPDLPSSGHARTNTDTEVNAVYRLVYTLMGPEFRIFSKIFRHNIWWIVIALQVGQGGISWLIYFSRHNSFLNFFHTTLNLVLKSHMNKKNHSHVSHLVFSFASHVVWTSFV